jgi:hypothetical protein
MIRSLRKWFAFLLVSLLGALTSNQASAQPTCTALKVGTFFYRLHQTNGYDVTFRVTNTGSRDENQRLRHTIALDAWQNKQPEGPSYIPPDGRGSGTLSPQGGLSIKVNWNNGTIGVYTAKANISGDGFILVSGTTYDETHPNSRAKWTSKDRLSCAQ